MAPASSARPFPFSRPRARAARAPDPDMMPKLRVDRGAIKFVLSGANIMCPGLTSPGASLIDDVAAETPVAIHAEGKELALAIGLTKLSCADMCVRAPRGCSRSPSPTPASRGPLFSSSSAR